MNTKQLLRRFDAMLDAYNALHEAQQTYRDTHITREGDETTEALYEAAYELCNRIRNVVTSVEWESVMLDLENGGER